MVISTTDTLSLITIFNNDNIKSISKNKKGISNPSNSHFNSMKYNIDIFNITFYYVLEYYYLSTNNYCLLLYRK